MIGVQDLRKGTTYIEDGDLWRVLEYEHVKTGRGNATIRVKVRNVRSGSAQDQDLSLGQPRAGYPAGSCRGAVSLPRRRPVLLHEHSRPTSSRCSARRCWAIAVNFLVDGMTLELESYEGESINVELPTTVDLEVIQTDPGFAGDTATNATKPAKVEHGLSGAGAAVREHRRQDPGRHADGQLFDARVATNDE